MTDEEASGRLSEALRVLATATTDLHLAVKDCGLSVRETVICSCLLTGSATTTTQLSNQTQQRYSSTAAAVSRLVARGLITSRPAVGDRRMTELSLTTAGRQATGRALAAVDGWFRDHPMLAASVTPDADRRC